MDLVMDLVVDLDLVVVVVVVVVGGGPAEDIAAALVLALVFQCIFMYVNVIFMVWRLKD